MKERTPASGLCLSCWMGFPYTGTLQYSWKIHSLPFPRGKIRRFFQIRKGWRAKGGLKNVNNKGEEKIKPQKYC
jgi:hypothetical protein